MMRTTIVMLLAVCSMSTIALAKEVTPKDIEVVQRCLLLIGFEPGPVDGIAGPATKGAFRAWAWSRFGPSYLSAGEALIDRFLDECLDAEDKHLKVKQPSKIPQQSW